MIETFEILAKAIADPSRVRILKLLEHGELCVCQITAVLDLAPATVSKHLSGLRTAGLIQLRRDGRWMYYRLSTIELNRYARSFLELVARLPADDPTLAEDRRILALVTAVPLSVLCAEGRAALPAGLSAAKAAACCGGPK